MQYASIALLSVFSLLAITHAVMAYKRIIQRMSGFSSVPLINGLIGAVGLGLSPHSAFSLYWWFAFLIDWGCLPLMIEYVIWRLRRRSASRPAGGGSGTPPKTPET